MSKMTVIQLLNKIANDEEVPKKIKYINSIWEYDKETKDYFHDDLWLIYSMNSIGLTKGEVEIIEEEKKTKPLTKKDIEALGYACGEIQKCFINGWTKSLETKPLEEEHKIPEKLENVKFENGKFYLSVGNKHNYIIREVDKVILNKVNEIIDYLEVHNG